MTGLFGRDCSLSKDQVDKKASDLLGQMTLKEKVWLLNGNFDPVRGIALYRNAYNPRPIKTNGCKRLGISPIAFSDGPRGVVMGKSTCFPVSMARGASFDRDLERRIGDVIGKECRAQGANYFAGVCINLLRHPAWGRAQETYGEDPYLLGEMGKCLTESVQDHNIMACIKHYAVNNIENSRFFVNVKCDDRTLHEVYLPHFKKCVDAGSASLMGAYNLYDGDQCCESRKLLTDILRDEWGFEGFTSSDFLYGIRDGVKAIEAGMDVEMPTPVEYQRKLLKAVQDGRVSESIIDQAVLRVLCTQLVFENSPEKMSYTKKLIASPEHIALAREAAEKSMVLIKNSNNVLPLKKGRILVVGEMAAKENTGDHGSSRIYAPYVISPLDGLKAYLGDQVVYSDGRDLEAVRKMAPEFDAVLIVAGNDCYDEGEYVVDDSADMAVPVYKGYFNQHKYLRGILTWLGTKVMKGSYTSMEAGEGGDRKSLSLKPHEIELIKELGPVSPQTAVILVGGSMIMTHEWDDKVQAILYSWYSGMEGGNALASIIFGDVNPSGKLPFTIPESEDHLPYFSSTDEEIEYDLYHGYTLLDKNEIEPAYPFGFGLSYTSWDYDDLKVALKGDRVEATITVANTGKMDGEEAVQLYVGMSDSKVERQKKLLKGFEKVFVKAGEKSTLTISVPLDELRYYDEKAWKLEPGEYTIYVGPSSADLLSARITI